MSKNKGFIGIGFILAIVLGIVVIVGGAYYLGKSGSKQEVKNSENILPNNQNQNLPVVDNSQQVNVANTTHSSSITVLSPNGGEVYKDTDKIAIKWKDTGKDRIAIYLRFSSGEWCLIKDVPSTDTNYIFTPLGHNCGDGRGVILGVQKYKITLMLYQNGGMAPEPGTAFAGDYSDNDGSDTGYSIDSSDNYFTINSGASTVDLKTYTNSKYSFSLNYPVGYLLNESNNGGFYNELNIFDLSLGVPSDYQKGTDFSNGTIDISVSPTTAKCYYSNGTDEDMTALKVINNKSFHYNPKQPFPDSAMGGQRGSASMFSIIEKGQCYRIQKLVGYRDLRGFAEPPYPPHFDEQKANLDLDNIISTFKFL